MEHWDSKVATFLFGALALNACSAQEPAVLPGWKSDCVGRMQLTLPLQLEVAAQTPASWDSRAGSVEPPRPRFSDEQVAGYSRNRYQGLMEITRPLTTEEQAELTSRIESGRKRFAVQASKMGSSGAAAVRDIPVAPQKGIAWQWRDTRYAVLYAGKHIFSWDVSFRTQAESDVERTFRSVLLGFSERPIFTSPKQDGVCLPYSFIKDDGQQSRSIGVTYRLQDHPDVTVWLEDSSANAPTPEQDPDKFTADYRTNFFWTQRYQDRTTLKLLSRKTTDNLMDGRKGVATVVELVRKDGVTIDYGYLAVVRGDPEAKQDTPDLMLYVIRDAKNAIDKGKPPIDKEELIKMAQTIAASVRHRPTK